MRFSAALPARPGGGAAIGPARAGRQDEHGHRQQTEDEGPDPHHVPLPSVVGYDAKIMAVLAPRCNRSGVLSTTPSQVRW
ncbi:hypothetical protein GCM10023085_57580 [Actinomadura viridis]